MKLKSLTKKYKLYLDTANDDFVIALFDEKYCKIADYVLTNYQKKVKLIPEYFLKILREHKLSVNNFDEFFTNLGPGFFTGVRISLVFLRTIALFQNANLKTISSFQILAKQNPNQSKLFINASGNKVYVYQPNTNFFNEKDILIELKEANYSINKIDYEEFLNNFATYLPLFKSYSNLMKIEPYYVKMPQIGEKKD
ncbi:tRNA (adenosine(37)-N6)-threonylcarbamoyltransferase complex dimerization subunit type 1 TsaB [Mycoplasmopsis gallinarum]|uniref:tRNA (adenosine(37)-N6)-threonylcarbamoyltransferase complex dimerization subunit type 1 TsaB n=1 Tax=Mycoplasmopsis gallinarum TaxID=29557 RepID=UPI0007C56C56|nr:tRNA (adenosine(37)-N6)-threonylcarbamoyltransferase complex dimerization subunit type 1 TsaB [Mycoplasmopsis gallinarum]